MSQPFFTIGHSTRSVPEFVELLTHRRPALRQHPVQGIVAPNEMVLQRARDVERHQSEQREGKGIMDPEHRLRERGSWARTRTG